MLPHKDTHWVFHVNSAAPCMDQLLCNKTFPAHMWRTGWLDWQQLRPAKGASHKAALPFCSILLHRSMANEQRMCALPPAPTRDVSSDGAVEP